MVTTLVPMAAALVAVPVLLLVALVVVVSIVLVVLPVLPAPTLLLALLPIALRFSFASGLAP
jgi:hypothetical protein